MVGVPISKAARYTLAAKSTFSRPTRAWPQREQKGNERRWCVCVCVVCRVSCVVCRVSCVVCRVVWVPEHTSLKIPELDSPCRGPNKIKINKNKNNKRAVR
jgi:hypothetical protein